MIWAEVGLFGCRIVWRRRIADFGEFAGGPGAFADQGNVGVDYGQFIGAAQAHDVFIVQVVGEDAGDRVQVGEIAVVPDSVMHELDGREAHRSHEVVGFGFGHQRTSGINFDMGLGNHRGQLFAFGVDSEGRGFFSVKVLGKSSAG